MFYDVVVLGSINMDVRVETNNYPEYSETVLQIRLRCYLGKRFKSSCQCSKTR